MTMSKARWCWWTRDGIVVQADLTHDNGHGERKVALKMINRRPPASTRRVTLGVDKGYDRADFVSAIRHMVATPHVARDRPDIPPSTSGLRSNPATPRPRGAGRRSKNPSAKP